MLRILVYYFMLINGLVYGENAYSSNMYFHGTLIEPPPCIINGDKPINVDFGDSVVTTKVDGVNYKRPVDYTLNCENSQTSILKIQIKGNASAFDSTILLTSSPNLGIQIFSDGVKLSVNEWDIFAHNTPPVLEVVPIKNKNAILKGGKFDATATLLIDVI
ncbi:fimbrial protein [Yersinia ruckeri]|uniref:fimbrial protein n=1 Tax=Yersinia ruckeri TaxID=29486 RepID=UPI0004E36CFB|nr:fimbrial protein [Yersinia ruckeri]ARZ01922.1 exported pilin protein [Yersinia ruckeri]AUQ40635.1 exotoxin [Yersinia ruckeri]EKN4198580.1 fimbrial protein [Yersinia ruckeri]EKN4205194.1 fimbrial protein [Yersinia ruckeri]EKN4688020.1 fimbrial protein [Yersinia ruckeri]